MPSVTTALTAALGFAVAASAQLIPEALVTRSDNLDYEYVVVGSGAGGGPLAARLALAGYKTLLIDAGDDQGSNNNYTVPAFQAKSTEDPAISWDFFVRHYEDDSRQKLDYKLTYSLPDGGEYTGLNPPADASIKGILYPRAGTLGGCTAHNALVTILPDDSDFDNLAALTNDSSWRSTNMRKYWEKIEDNNYIPLPLAPGHGYKGWLSTEVAPIKLALNDKKLFSMISGAAAALGNGTQILGNFLNVLLGDANSDSRRRDTTSALYQIPIASKDGARASSREFILQVANARFDNGTKMYPLDVRLNCLVTKVTFDQSGSVPKATGVNFLDGKSLYRADPRAKNAAPGTPGSASASREVIVAGGSYNSPQILKLSGIGPADELEQFNIPVVADLPGVGSNLQDHYEVAVQGRSKDGDFTVLNNCTFGFTPGPDQCLETWKAGAGSSGNSKRGTYASSGFAATMFLKTNYTPDQNYDIFEFGGPVNFRGYFPGYSYNATSQHDWWTWAILKSHPRNTAGSVTLASADPQDMPNILFNYFDTGSGDSLADLNEIVEGIKTARNAFSNQKYKFNEVLPGADVTTDDQIRSYVKNTAWGHHCSSTCAIGPDSDPMAVLDSSFRVRKVQGLRVVDASVYPRIPGTFTAASTYMVGEKAADVIISALEK